MEVNKNFKILFFITLLIWSVSAAFPLNPDYDLWIRLIVGNSFISEGQVYLRDMFSYTPTHIWYDHEWGAGVIFACVMKFADIIKTNPVYMFAALKSFLIFLIAVITFMTVIIRNPKQSSPYQILYFILPLFAVNMVYSPTIRSQMFTFLFFALWIFILESYRIKQNYFLLLILPLTMIFWGNIHGGCLSGIGLLLIYTTGEFLNRKNPVPYILAILLCLSSLLINPYGTAYIKFLFEAGTLEREWISEWQSPFATPFLHLKFITFFVFLSAVTILRGISTHFDLNKYDKTKLLAVGITALAGIFFVKFTPFYAITAAIFMFDDVYFVLKKIKTGKSLLNPCNKAVYGILLLTALGTVNLYKTQSPVNLKKYPYMPAEFLKENRIKGNLFTDITYGSFCIYKLFPQNKIFMDGRYEEVYDPKLLIIMKDFIRQEGRNPNSVINDFPTDIVLLDIPVRNMAVPAEKALRENKWKEIYYDGFWKIYINPEYKLKNINKVRFNPKNTSDKMFNPNKP